MEDKKEIRKFSEINQIPFPFFLLTPGYSKDSLLKRNKRICLKRNIAFYQIFSGEQSFSLCSVYNIMDIIFDRIEKHKYFIAQEFRKHIILDSEVFLD